MTLNKKNNLLSYFITDHDKWFKTHFTPSPDLVLDTTFWRPNLFRPPHFIGPSPIIMRDWTFCHATISHSDILSKIMQYCVWTSHATFCHTTIHHDQKIHKRQFVTLTAICHSTICHDDNLSRTTTEDDCDIFSHDNLSQFYWRQFVTPNNLDVFWLRQFVTIISMRDSLSRPATLTLSDYDYLSQ
jgi:hypothetical protein